MYHRILPASDARAQYEEPGMVVSPETFSRHLTWLSEEFEPIQLSEWIRRARNHESLPRRACAITFDDGWRDNYEFAFPLLAGSGIPATVFLVSDMIGTRQLFWPNRLVRLLTRSDFISRTPYWYPILGRHVAADDGEWTREQFATVIAACKRLPENELLEKLAEAESATGLGEPDVPLLLDWDQVRDSLARGTIEIGCHTRRHSRLVPTLSENELMNEIVHSKREIERLTNVDVRLFCYPNGDYTTRARAIVEANYDAAVTTVRGINSSSTPLFELRRIGLHDDISFRRSDFMACLSALA